MKNQILTVSAIAVLFMVAFKPAAEKLKSTKTHIKFFSTTPAEDIEANNYQSVGVIDQATGDVVFSVPMQSFEFDKSLMQKHFNNKDFLNTKEFPKAKLKGTITNLSEIDFAKDGIYDATVEGDLTIKGVTKPLSTKGTVTVADGKVKVNSKFDVTLADHGIAFKKGKPSTNVAKVVEVTVVAEF